MGYWTELAQSTKAPEADGHPWGTLLDSTLERVNPDLYRELEASGELAGYIAVKVADATKEYDRLKTEEDMPDEMAYEIVMEDLLPQEPDSTEDWELEGGDEDDAAALADFLGGPSGNYVEDEEDDDFDDEDDEDEEDEDEPEPPSKAPKGMVEQFSREFANRGMVQRYAKDAHGNEHKGKGPGGGQFTSQGQGGGSGGASGADKASAAPSKAPGGPSGGIRQDSPQRGSRQQAAPAAGQPTEPAGKKYNPHVDADHNKNGIDDQARVGVPAFEFPPPPKVRRIPPLTGMAKEAEEDFASAYERNPDAAIDAAMRDAIAASGPDSPPTFETDACKAGSRHWQSAALDQDLDRRNRNRATLNTALHQTANAIAKRAFVKYLDTLKPGSEILVTVGGCGAGKGYALGNVPEALALKQRAAVVWDSAGDQNATENPAILQEARKRGLKVSYVYVHADPKVAWADPSRGVVQRAMKPTDGRMVDAMVFADSYARGAKNHAAFHAQEKNSPDVTFAFLQNGNPPKLLEGMPPEALQVDSHALRDFAVATINSRPDLPEHIRQGALAGQDYWED